jgi:hypothetical protein
MFLFVPWLGFSCLVSPIPTNPHCRKLAVLGRSSALSLWDINGLRRPPLGRRYLIERSQSPLTQFVRRHLRVRLLPPRLLQFQQRQWAEKLVGGWVVG